MELNTFLFSFAATYPILLYLIRSSTLASLFFPMLFYLLAPLFLIRWMWINPNCKFKIWLFKVVCTGIYSLNLFILGFWPIVELGYYFRYALLLAFVISAVKSYVDLRNNIAKEKSKSLEHSSKRAWHLISYIPFLTILSLMSWEIAAALKGTKNPGNSIELEFPLKKGSYYVVQGGNHSCINHHHSISGQRYALDIIKLDYLGLRANSLLPDKLSYYHIFNEDVYSPCSGFILKVINSCNDQSPGKMDPSNPAGNYVAIQMEGTDKIVVLAHLLRHSVQVQEGDLIQKGKLLGKVGNSGNTSEPHLHIHCVSLNNKDDLFFEGESVPLTFQNEFLVRNSVFISKISNEYLKKSE
jgi:hypothetical protein